MGGAICRHSVEFVPGYVFAIKLVRLSRTHCPQVRSGYLVVFKSNASLPDGAELSFNVSQQNDLDTLMAALSYLSPNAKLVEGAGM